MTGGALRSRPAHEEGHNIMTKHTKIVAILTARPGMAGGLRELLGALAASSRAEPGNLRFDLWVDQADAGRFTLDELYVDPAAVAAHRQTPHFLDYLSRIGDLADRTALVLDAVDVA